MIVRRSSLLENNNEQGIINRLAGGEGYMAEMPFRSLCLYSLAWRTPAAIAGRWDLAVVQYVSGPGDGSQSGCDFPMIMGVEPGADA